MTNSAPTTGMNRLAIRGLASAATAMCGSGTARAVRACEGAGAGDSPGAGGALRTVRGAGGAATGAEDATGPRSATRTARSGTIAPAVGRDAHDVRAAGQPDAVAGRGQPEEHAAGGAPDGVDRYRNWRALAAPPKSTRCRTLDAPPVLAAMSALMLFAVYELAYPFQRGESATVDVFTSVVDDGLSS